MSQLKTKNLKKCFSLLKEFIEETPSMNNKKGLAVMALNQLQKITAGTGSPNDSRPPDPDRGCIDIPRIDENPDKGNG
jgi:hypothetical protein